MPINKTLITAQKHLHTVVFICIHIDNEDIITYDMKATLFCSDFLIPALSCPDT